MRQIVRQISRQMRHKIDHIYTKEHGIWHDLSIF
jgi:hypothetical protein